MSSYRERLLGNWFSHYQRAETARVRDKRVKKLSTLTLSVYPHIPPCIPSSLSLSLCDSVFYVWFVSPFQALNHQTTILLSALLRTEAVSVTIHLQYYFKLLIDVNIHLHTVVLCLSPRTIKKMEFSFTTGKSL